MINKKLMEELLDSYHEDDAGWVESNQTLDYDYCACSNIVKVTPEDAKTLDEIESFEVTEDISGIEIKTCTRRKA